VALIAALFASGALGSKANARAVFVTLGFTGISSLLFLSSVATPNIIIPGATNQVFIWSLRLSLPVGGFFFTIAAVRWTPSLEKRIVNHRRLLWLIGLIVFVGFVYLAFAWPVPLAYLSQFDPYLQYGLASITIPALLWAAWRTRFLKWHNNQTLENRLAISLILLAEAEICLSFGVAGSLSWLIYLPLTTGALLMALSAILSIFKTSRDVQLTRYFAALGSILIAGLSLVGVELGVRWLTTGDSITRTSLIPLMVAQGALSFVILYVIVIHLNGLITEQTEALRREQHLRSELTQLIVHDLKSPLTVILSGMNLLGRENLGRLTGTQQRLVNSLEQSGHDILRMINDLLDVERLEDGVLSLQKSLTDPFHLLKERVDELQVLASTNKQSLTITAGTNLPEIRVDRELMRRVLNNLLINALKFTPEGGQIAVEAGVEQSRVVFTVGDSGPGVPLSERSRIFQKFAQVQGGERRGAGLGLTFCKMAVEAHGGTLVVEDSPLGGALFKISLPFGPEGESALTAELEEKHVTSSLPLTQDESYPDWKLEAS